MPIYEYACTACGKEAEIMHKISDPPVRKCPACGKLKLEKQVSAAGFRLGGGGWYETDFKKDGKRNLADKGEAAAKPTGEGKAPEKKETKETAKKEAPKAEGKKAAKAA